MNKNLGQIFVTIWDKLEQFVGYYKFMIFDVYDVNIMIFLWITQNHLKLLELS